jgi:hypothetical protein
MALNPSRLRRGELLAGIGGLALLVFLFALPWLSAAGHNHAGWTALPTLRWLLVITALTGLALLLTQAGLRAPAVPVSLSVIVTVLAGLSVLALVIRLLTTGDGLCAGIFLGLAAAIVIAVGGYQSMRREQGWTPGPDRPVETVPLHRS